MKKFKIINDETQIEFIELDKKKNVKFSKSKIFKQVLEDKLLQEIILLYSKNIFWTLSVLIGIGIYYDYNIGNLRYIGLFSFFIIGVMNNRYINYRLKEIKQKYNNNNKK